MKRQIAIFVFVLLAATSAFADIARPDKNPSRVPKPKGYETTMMIKLVRDATEAKLIIPKSQIKQLRAELERIDDDTDNTAAVTDSGFSRAQTIMSGVFLCLAFVFGGIWFARSGKASSKTAKTLAVLTCLAAVGSAATFVFANAGPPAEARSITGKMFSQAVHIYKFGSGKIRVETSNDADAQNIELIVPDPQPSPTPAE